MKGGCSGENNLDNALDPGYRIYPGTRKSTSRP